MGKVRYSRAAERDLCEIEDYTLERWGVRQALHYLRELDGCCQRLLLNPDMGRNAGEIRAGLRRISCERHVIFYRADEEGIWVSRILHEGMSPGRHAFA